MVVIIYVTKSIDVLSIVMGGVPLKSSNSASLVATCILKSSFMFAAYAFAELIDNALAATAENFGPRNIEILLVSCCFRYLSIMGRDIAG